MHRIPVMHQRWNNITFFHWSCNPSSIQTRLPAGLDVDTFDGQAWVGLTPFYLSHLRLPFLPPMPWLSQFPETNLRTYVRGPAGPGVWFFSLDASRFAAVAGARLCLGLPYYWADLRTSRTGESIHYYASRGGRAGTDIQVETGKLIVEKTDLAQFLTERYRLYSLWRGRLLTVEVAHPSWVLHEARTIRFRETLRKAQGVSIGELHPMILFSPGVDTMIYSPKLAS